MRRDERGGVTATSLYGLGIIVRVATIAYAAIRLPEQIATHFGASGRPDGWGTRAGYLAVDIAISALVVLGIPMLTAALLSGSGKGLNVPNKDYWLRPENRDRFRSRMTADMFVISAATSGLLSWVDVEMVQANAMTEPALGSSWIAVVVFMVFTVGYSIWMVTGRYAVPAGTRTH